MAMKLLLTLGLVCALYFVAVESQRDGDRRNLERLEDEFQALIDSRRSPTESLRSPNSRAEIDACSRVLDQFDQVCDGNNESPRCIQLEKRVRAVCDVLDKDGK